MHHQYVVTDNQVSFLPSMVVRNSPVVKSGVNGFANSLAGGLVLVFDADKCGLELGLGLGPRFVISEAGLASSGMRRNQRDSL